MTQVTQKARKEKPSDYARGKRAGKIDAAEWLRDNEPPRPVVTRSGLRFDAEEARRHEPACAVEEYCRGYVDGFMGAVS